MGAFMSQLGALPKNQLINLVVDKLYDRFMTDDVKDFEKFHVAFLNLLSFLNECTPGAHYDPPLPEDIEDTEVRAYRTDPVQKFYQWWVKSEETDEKKKESFISFLMATMTFPRPDKLAQITGVIAPPVALVTKNSIQKTPALGFVKHVPNVLFVPSATILAIVSVKLSKSIVLGREQREK